MCMFVPKRLHIAAIFVIAKKWKQPKYLFNRMNNKLYIYIPKYSE